MTNTPLVTRFAPSPTGHLHIGGARTALFCWAFAKKNAGRFMIRIEDTDQARSSDESARGILDDLAWLGIEWDDGPKFTTASGRIIGEHARDVGSYFQAQRKHLYNAYIEHLVKMGRAYPAFESNADLDKLRKEAAAKKATFKYPRPADVKLGVFNEARWQRAQSGEPHVIRFAMPTGEVVVDDQVLGPVKFAQGEVDDLVIRKADGFPTYHFAVVIDDELMGVTHVLRAQEHLMNTPRHVAMQRALTRIDGGAPFRTPVYAHMPLIFNTDGTKMSKRDKAKAARAVIRTGFDIIEQRYKGVPPVPIFKGVSGMTASELTGVILRMIEEAQSPLDPKFEKEQFDNFISGESDDIRAAEQIAEHFKLSLPEIEVWDYRKSGYLPEAITNFIALLGWSPGAKDAAGKDLEKFDNAYLAANFSIDRIGKTNARFDRVKLLSFNGDAVKQLSDAEFIRRLKVWADEFHKGLLAPFTQSQIALLVPALKPRCRIFAEAVPQLALFALPAESVTFDAPAVAKHLTANGRAGLKLVETFTARLEALPAFEPAAIESLVEQFAAERAIKMGEVAQPLRVALTGNTVSPPLGLTMAVFGKEATLARLRRCLQTCK